MQNKGKRPNKRPHTNSSSSNSKKPNGKGFRPHGKGVRPPFKPNKSKLLQTDAEIEELKSNYANIVTNDIKKFTDFPLSKKTLKALNEFKYTTPTEVQRLSIGHALQGRDVLGAAVTGSGKTLAFLIPVLEHLYISKWSRTDGIGAIIISPTRELAYQIFETLKKVGKEHDISAGLIIGGKNLKFERTRMDQCNILICTPGRLLQHMDENPLFNASSMEMLVLDEADRCLDMGFEQCLNSIIENFPPQRQTLLFSATQTNTVEDLARLNLNDPVYVGYRQHLNAENKDGSMLAVPELLQQSYVVLPLEEKITMLWSFIKNHQKQKIIVFLSTCKQVKYIYEIFCKLRPGTSLLALYGTLHQDRRIAIYEDFVRKSNVVLFATDVASRGLDFPAVNWVVQLDCPEDVSQYIHRAGRSARNKTRGECLLVLLPSEEEHMLEELKKQKIEIRHIQIDPKKLFSPRVKIEAFLAQFPELKATAQRAFQSYVKSVFLQKNKRIFNVLSLDLDAFAHALGLAVTPRVRFLERIMWRLKQAQTGGDKKETKKEKQQQQDSESATTSESETESEHDSDDDDDDESDTAASKGKVLSKPKRQADFKTHSSGPESDDDDDDDDFIRIKRRDHDVAANDDGDEEELEALVVPKREKKLVTKAALAKKAIKKKLQINTKVTFDEDGTEVIDTRKQMQALRDINAESDNEDVGGINIMRSKLLLTEEDKHDKQRFRELVKKRHKLAREKLKKKFAEADDDDVANGDADDDFNAAVDHDAEDSDDDAHSVDLSWLPDPDKIYKKDGKENENIKDAESVEDDDDEADAETEEPLHKKLKITDKLTLNDTEAIAASLLGFAQ